MQGRYFTTAVFVVDLKSNTRVAFPYYCKVVVDLKLNTRVVFPYLCMGDLNQTLYESFQVQGNENLMT